MAESGNWRLRLQIEVDLQQLKKGTPGYRQIIEALRQDLKESGLTLEHFYTSEKDLEDMRVNCCRFTATSCLRRLRAGTEYYQAELKVMREELQSGNLTLEDIKTDEKELIELLKKQQEREKGALSKKVIVLPNQSLFNDLTTPDYVLKRAIA